MKTLKKCILAILFAGLLSMLTVGCNTVDGMGKDLEKGGESIQDAAD